jgi:hypothetical protein
LEISHTISNLIRAFPIVIATAAAYSLCSADRAAADVLKSGDVLDTTTWQKAEGLLPPEILKHYENGEYANPIVEWPEDKFSWAPDFKAGSEKSAGQLDVDDLGTISEKGTPISRASASTLSARVNRLGCQRGCQAAART